MLQALAVLAVIELIGLAATPVARGLLGRLPGAGVGLAKPLGLLLAGWLLWLAASLHLVAATRAAAAGAVGVLAFAGLVVAWRSRGRAADPYRRPLWVGAEIVFVLAYVGLAALVSFVPDVWGTEKPMDMAFLAAIDAARHFPPHDPWFSGASLNYYYLGQLLIGLPARIAGVPLEVAYTTGLALAGALTAAGVFALGATLRALWGGTPAAAVRGGVLAVALVVVAGNLAAARALVELDGPLTTYDWFAPSRVVPGAINEVPAFSLLVGDLHAHLLALPFTAVALGFVLQVAVAGPRRGRRGAPELVVTGLSIAALYAINSWSAPVTAGLLALALAAWLRDPRSAGARAGTVTWGVLALATGALALLPFALDFEPATNGIGRVTERQELAPFLGDLALLYGLPLWLLAAAYLGRLRATPRRAAVAAGVTLALVVAGALAAEVDLAGALLVAAALGAALLALLRRGAQPAERALWLLVAGGLACVLGPELLYIRDAFDGGELFRMNTVFKLGYQAWFLLGIAAAVAPAASRVWLPVWLRVPWALAGAVLAAGALAYPVAGWWARTGGLRGDPTLDGMRWLERSAPGDTAAIRWLREHAPPGAVVLEAVGDDYSPDGHARISTFSGRPTVLGWPGHELQWRHDPDTRRADVERMYRWPDVGLTRALLDRYGVDYVVAGELERATYGPEAMVKWPRLGRLVLRHAGTELWALQRRR